MSEYVRDSKLASTHAFHAHAYCISLFFLSLPRCLSLTHLYVNIYSMLQVFVPNSAADLIASELLPVLKQGVIFVTGEAAWWGDGSVGGRQGLMPVHDAGNEVKGMATDPP